MQITWDGKPTLANQRLCTGGRSADVNIHPMKRRRVHRRSSPIRCGGCGIRDRDEEAKRRGRPSVRVQVQAYNSRVAYMD